MRKTPGKSHREGISLEKLFQMFPDDATAEKWFVEQRWPDGAHCPHCGSVNVTGTKHKTMPYLCRERDCRKRFSVRIGTPMECSKLGYKIWVIAIYLMTTSLKGVSSMKLHRDLGITQKSAWHLAHRLRTAFESDGFDPPFIGPVEADETYMGGKERLNSRIWWVDPQLQQRDRIWLLIYAVGCAHTIADNFQGIWLKHRENSAGNPLSCIAQVISRFSRQFLTKHIKINMLKRYRVRFAIHPMGASSDWSD